MKKLLFAVLILGVIWGALRVSGAPNKDFDEKIADIGKTIKKQVDNLLKKENDRDNIADTDKAGQTTANPEAVTDTVSTKKPAQPKTTTEKLKRPPRCLYCVREETVWIRDQKWTSYFVHNYTCPKFIGVNGRRFKIEDDLSQFLKKKESKQQTMIIDCDICGGRSIP